MKVLYLTYDGLSDPLGQSQVMPYLLKLADKGFSITIISFEKKTMFTGAFEDIKKKLDEKKISWVPLNYTSRPPVLSTIFDIIKLKRQCIRLQKIHHYRIVHCRSYITSFAGMMMKQKFGLKFIFDMRGFYADERVEGGLWNQNKIIFRYVYNYFKKKEKLFFRNADKTVTLTEAAKEIIVGQFSVPKMKVKVIPCCVDTSLFNPAAINSQLQSQVRKRLSIKEKDFVISYLGAIGTWYLLDEMLGLFKQLSDRFPDAKFLFITYHPRVLILESAFKLNIPVEKIIVEKAGRNEVPLLLSLSSLSLFFIKQTFSKIASSPTKQAEILAMGIPLICNTQIGDTEAIVTRSGAGLLINQFTINEFDKVINGIPTLLQKDKTEIRNFAIHEFSLERGVDAYNEIYLELKK